MSIIILINYTMWSWIIEKKKTFCQIVSKANLNIWKKKRGQLKSKDSHFRIDGIIYLFAFILIAAYLYCYYAAPPPCALSRDTCIACCLVLCVCNFVFSYIYYLCIKMPWNWSQFLPNKLMHQVVTGDSYVLLSGVHISLKLRLQESKSY